MKLQQNYSGIRTRIQQSLSLYQVKNKEGAFYGHPLSLNTFSSDDGPEGIVKDLNVKVE